jgi:hypothetical protein
VAVRALAGDARRRLGYAGSPLSFGAKRGAASTSKTALCPPAGAPTLAPRSRAGALRADSADRAKNRIRIAKLFPARAETRKERARSGQFRLAKLRPGAEGRRSGVRARPTAISKPGWVSTARGAGAFSQRRAPVSGAVVRPLPATADGKLGRRRCARNRKPALTAAAKP